jgi:hypothetical protein
VIELLTATMLFFRGAGPGAANGYPYQFFDTSTSETASFRATNQNEPIFLRSSHDGKSITGVVGFGTSRQTMVELALTSRELRSICYVEATALFFPVLSPDRAHVAALVTPGQLGMPPSSFEQARLIVFDIEESDGGTPKQISASIGIDTGLPLVPIDWSRDGRRLFYVSRIGGEEQVVSYSTRDRSRKQIGPGVFPRASPDGKFLAYIHERSVIVYDLAEKKAAFVQKTSKSIEWLDWNPSGDMLVFSEVGPAYHSQISVLNTKNWSSGTVFETGLVKDLVWVAASPAWEKFSP